MSSSDSVSSEWKPKPCFSHLPWFLKQRIVDSTDLITRCRLRRVSKELIHCVDNSSFNIEMILFTIYDSWVQMIIYTGNRTSLTYMNSDRFKEQEPPEGSSSVQRSDYLETAVRDLTALFRNSKLTVRAFLFGYAMYDTDYMKSGQYLTDQALFRSTFKTVFDQLPHQLNVRILQTTGLDKADLMLFEPYLKPAVLKETYQIVYNSDFQLQEKVHLIRRSEKDPWEPEAR